MSSEPSREFVDVHSHVLPGVDDGAPDLATSLVLLRAAASAGTRVIVATSHQHPGRYPNTADTLRRAHETLLEACERWAREGEVLPEVRLGAEVHLDAGLEGAVARGERLRLAGAAFLLLELPDQFPVAAVEDLVFRLRLDGTTPLLAHPERNGQLLRDPAQVARLVELGCLVQVTGMSLAGDFGAPCRTATEDLVTRGLVHVVASDTHDPRRRPPGLARAFAAVSGRFGDDAARRLFIDNPRDLLAGTAPAPVVPGRAQEGGVPASRKSLLARLRRWVVGARPGTPA